MKTSAAVAFIALSLVEANDDESFGPFTPGPKDGMLFAQRIEGSAAVVFDSNHPFTLLKCDEDDGCGCTTAGCLGGGLDFLLKTVKVDNGEKAIASAKNWNEILMACPKPSQTATIKNARCFSSGKNVRVTKVFSFQSVIQKISLNKIKDDCGFEDLVTIEFLCKNNGNQEENESTSTGHKSSSLRKGTVTPLFSIQKGKFLFVQPEDFGRNSFVAGEGFHFELLQPVLDEASWCSESVCIGEEVSFLIQGQNTDTGEKVVLSSTFEDPVNVLCPYTNQKISFRVIEGCKQNGVTAKFKAGPVLILNKHPNCNGEFVTIAFFCTNP